MRPDIKLSKYANGERVYASKYCSLIWTLRYLTNTRLNLMLTVGIVVGYMDESR